LPDGSITQYTLFVLVNALYFHATWLTQFDPTMTQPAPFTRLDGSVVQAPEMTSPAASCALEGGSNYVAGELQYANQQTSMVIVLPDPGQFGAVESALTGSFVSALFSRLSAATPTGIHVSLPKFSIKSDTFSLRAELEKLGMTDAFQKGADFSAMLPSGGVFLSDVLQQAYIDVSEAGTKASAATAVVGGYGEVAGDQAPPSLVVDRPFLFVIRDIPTNTALFVGRVLDPTQ
jgi:serpin B